MNLEVQENKMVGILKYSGIVVLILLIITSAHGEEVTATPQLVPPPSAVVEQTPEPALPTAEVKQPTIVEQPKAPETPPPPKKPPYFEILMGCAQKSTFDSSQGGIYTKQLGIDAFDFAGRYVRDIGKEFEFYFEAAYETNRVLSGYVQSSGQYIYLTPLPNLSFIVLQAGVRRPYRDFYGFAGVGWDIVFPTTFNGQISGSWVAGGGVGYQVSETFSIEGAYRTANFSAIQNSTNPYDYYYIAGFQFNIVYSFR